MKLNTKKEQRNSFQISQLRLYIAFVLSSILKSCKYIENYVSNFIQDTTKNVMTQVEDVVNKQKETGVKDFGNNEVNKIINKMLDQNPVSFGIIVNGKKKPINFTKIEENSDNNSSPDAAGVEIIKKINTTKYTDKTASINSTFKTDAESLCAKILNKKEANDVEIDGSKHEISDVIACKNKSLPNAWYKSKELISSWVNFFADVVFNKDFSAFKNVLSAFIQQKFLVAVNVLKDIKQEQLADNKTVLKQIGALFKAVAAWNDVTILQDKLIEIGKIDNDATSKFFQPLEDFVKLFPSKDMLLKTKSINTLEQYKNNIIKGTNSLNIDEISAIFLKNGIIEDKTLQSQEENAGNTTFYRSTDNKHTDKLFAIQNVKSQDIKNDDYFIAYELKDSLKNFYMDAKAKDFLSLTETQIDSICQQIDSEQNLSYVQKIAGDFLHHHE